MSVSEMRKRARAYSRETSKRCMARGSHQDAIALVDYLLQRGGKTTASNEQIARDLGWEQRAGSARVVDMPRFQRAKNHLRDNRANDGKPCTGFNIHYRTSSKGNELLLVDPSGSLQHKLDVALRDIRGDLHQQTNFRTVNGRRIQSANDIADMCLQSDPTDVQGYHLMTEYAMELKRFGAPSNETLAELNVWIGQKS